MKTKIGIQRKLKQEQAKANQRLKDANESKDRFAKDGNIRQYNMHCEKIWLLKWVLE